MPSIAELAIQLTANTGRFTKGMAEAKTSLTSFTSSASKLSNASNPVANIASSISPILGAIASSSPMASAAMTGLAAAAAAAAATIGVAFHLALKQSEQMERIGNAADKLGANTTNLAAMKIGAEKAGLSFAT